MADKQPSWHWKVPGLEDERQPGLLYEPGNWGDVLKGTWAAVTAGVLAAAIEDHRPLRYLDPFAGMPTYSSGSWRLSSTSTEWLWPEPLPSQW